ncbi:MAG: hypothetical protein ONB52_21895 [candidate division KSB1 bacterium]|nr:hypothetical protein [candidate division KSB1 bacterium]
MKCRALELREAFLALSEWLAASKPSRDEQGRHVAPAVPPLPVKLGLHLALCRNSLKVVMESLDERIEEVNEKYRSLLQAQGSTALTPDQQREWNKEIRELLSATVEWQPPATIRLDQLGDRAVPEEWLAALVVVGVIERGQS